MINFSMIEGCNILIIIKMPLYEMVMITKCTQPAISANILKNVTKFICNKGGNVRDLKILADRYIFLTQVARKGDEID